MKSRGGVGDRRAKKKSCACPAHAVPSFSSCGVKVGLIASCRAGLRIAPGYQLGRGQFCAVRMAEKSRMRNRAIKVPWQENGVEGEGFGLGLNVGL